MTLRHLPANLFALLLLNLSVTFYLTGGQVTFALQTALALLILPPAWLLATERTNLRAFWHGLCLSLPLTGIFLLSILFNMSQYPDAGEAFMAMALVGSILFVTTIASILAGAEEDFMTPAMTLYSVLGALFLLYIIAFETTPGVLRQIPASIHPNWWGMQAFGIMAAALFLKRKSLRWAIWMVCLYMVFLVSARGSLLGCLVLMSMKIGAFLRQRHRTMALALGIFTGLSLMALLMFLFPEIPLLGDLRDFILYDVFWIDNRYRGLGTGGTGRMEYNLMALRIWMENPLLGIGYDNSYYIHNGILILLAETGIIGLGLFLALLAKAMRRAATLRDNPHLPIMVGYLVVLMTFNRALNVNAASIIFILSLWQSLVKNPGERGAPCPT